MTQPEVYSHHPTDFSRRRKLSFETTLKLLLAMEGKSLASELLNFFDFIPETPSVSAFVQARNKIKNEALERIFGASQTSLEQPKTYKGYRLIAHDGSDINIPYDKKMTELQSLEEERGKNLAYCISTHSITLCVKNILP